MISISADRSVRDRGETAAEAVVVVPALFLLVMFVLQSALYFHTAHVARAAAVEGAVAAAAHQVAVSEVPVTGSEQARLFATEAGGSLERNPDTDLSGGTVRVVVTLEVPSLVPFLSTHVTRDATEPKERILTESER